MGYRHLYSSINGVDDEHTVNISESHEGSVSIASVTAKTIDLTVGDSIDINLGFDDEHLHVFSGFVKRREKANPDGWITITANDDLVRAIDFFIVANNPDNPYTYNNISAENLIRNVLELAGLSNFNFSVPTFFTFGINNPVEVNLVSSYDYARMISDIIAWSFWCDQNGVIWLRNRKPYYMYTGMPDDDQPGFVADTPIATITDSQIYNFSVSSNEKDLRNKIVVYGNESMSASAQRSTSFNPLTGDYEQILPAGFYKAAVLASPLIDDQGFAQDAANYNLALYNRLTWEIAATVEGDPDLHARKVITLNSTKYSEYNGNWYIFQMDHAWSKGGYVCNLILRK